MDHVPFLVSFPGSDEKVGRGATPTACDLTMGGVGFEDDNLLGKKDEGVGQRK